MEFNTLKAISSATTLEQLSSEQVKELQEALTVLGYVLTPDGVLGRMTRGMWARFKADNGLGEPDSIGPGSVGILQHWLALDDTGTDAVPHQAVNLVSRALRDTEPVHIKTNIRLAAGQLVSARRCIRMATAFKPATPLLNSRP
jgi:peptidoglycan hydrolase-like protein with peptidoglycan-binding domain